MGARRADDLRPPGRLNPKACHQTSVAVLKTFSAFRRTPQARPKTSLPVPASTVLTSHTPVPRNLPSGGRVQRGRSPLWWGLVGTPNPFRSASRQGSGRASEVSAKLRRCCTSRPKRSESSHPAGESREGAALFGGGLGDPPNPFRSASRQGSGRTPTRSRGRTTRGEWTPETGPFGRAGVTTSTLHSRIRAGWTP